jgi:protein-disulfide isomerase
MTKMKSAAFFAFFALSAAASLAVAADSPKPVAKIGNTVLTEDDMRKDLAAQLYQAENQIYMIEKRWIDQKAEGLLFAQAAKEAGLSQRDWEAREIDAKAVPPAQQQIQQAAGQFIRPGVASTTTYKMAEDYLLNQSKAMRRSQLYQELQAKNQVQVMLNKPEAPRINVTYAADDPMKGPGNAPVTIVEFTDFQCPFCKRAQDTLKQVESTYSKDVKVVARQYPLPFHERAKPAAEAALCAKEQGKYWEYRDKLFARQELSDDDFRRYADELKMNKKKFDQCLTSHKYQSRVESDIADGQRFGVNGTPHFFINGESVVGAQPYEAFQTAIQSALAKK